ncbi:hypothetical protein O3M35_007731 [Rhynocoris fuscipes]|uniref:Uncharacterized protein n=1 Tax=Rhynocoris fuscipes TaxID=488301 RepID=A0AAW1DB27_9HEMI
MAEYSQQINFKHKITTQYIEYCPNYNPKCFLCFNGWHPCLSDVAQKLNKSKLRNIRMEYKKCLSYLQPFLRYFGHKNSQI